MMTPGWMLAAARLRPTPHRACRSSRVTPSRRPPGSSGTTVALRQIDDPVQSGGTRAVGGSCPPDPDEGTDQSVVGLIGSRTPRAQECEKQRSHEVIQLGQSLDAPVCDLHEQVISTCRRSSGDEARGILRVVAIRMFLSDPGLRFLHASYPIGAPAPGFRVGDRWKPPARRAPGPSLAGVALVLRTSLSPGFPAQGSMATGMHRHGGSARPRTSAGLSCGCGPDGPARRAARVRAWSRRW